MWAHLSDPVARRRGTDVAQCTRAGFPCFSERRVFLTCGFSPDTFVKHQFLEAVPGVPSVRFAECLSPPWSAPRAGIRTPALGGVGSHTAPPPPAAQEGNLRFVCVQTAGARGIRLAGP